MANFSRQPIIPPEPQAPRHEAAAPRPAGAPQAEAPLAYFAIVGQDHETGEEINTVIEARSEDDAQEIASRMGVTVHRFKAMNPMAGAAAVEAARRNPHDRINHRTVCVPTSAAVAQAHARHPQASAAVSPGAPNATIPAPASGAVRTPQTSNPLGALAVVGVIAAVAGLLYLTVLRDGGAQQVVAMIAPAPAPLEVEAAFDVTEPLGVDLSGIEGFEDWSANKPIDEIQPPKQTSLRLEATIPPSDAARANGQRGSAVIGGQIVTPGQTIAGYRLIQVRDGVVVMQKDGKIVALRIAQSK